MMVQSINKHAELRDVSREHIPIGNPVELLVETPTSDVENGEDCSDFFFVDVDRQLAPPRQLAATPVQNHVRRGERGGEIGDD